MSLTGSFARSGRPRRARRVFAAASVTALLFTGAACTRSSNDVQAGGGGGGGGSSSSSAPSPTATAAAGDFGTLKHICGPGNAKGATARGVTDSTITVGTMADAGSTITPGLEIEFFQVGDAFVKWCNAAGGINGRKIKLNKHDAKLFEAGTRTVEACRTDFMLVGNGSAFDQSTVKPRLACKSRADPLLRRLPAGDQGGPAGAADAATRPTRTPSVR